MTAEATYRPFAQRDVDSIYELALESWRHAYGDWLTREFILDAIDRDYNRDALLNLLPAVEAGTYFFWVAEDTSGMVGFCQMGEGEQGPQLFHLYLSPGHLRQGVGSTLLARGEAHFRSQGTRRYFCYVSKRNQPAVEFYRRQGFQHREEHDPEHWPGLYMEKALD